MSTTKNLHLAIIPDGNRRWARGRALKPWRGHEEAVRNTKTLIEWARSHQRLAVFTLWGFSTENWRRSEVEVRELMRIFEAWLRGERALFQERQTRFVHSGRQERIPTSLAQLIQDISEETAHFQDFTVHLALDYGGRDELMRAVRKTHASEVLDEADFRRQLDQPDLPDIDVIVRTSGERRLSNFFLWQAVFAELFFLDMHYPDLKPADLEEVVAQFDQRQRRFGG